jgi:hypothetical protein
MFQERSIDEEIISSMVMISASHVYPMVRMETQMIFTSRTGGTVTAIADWQRIHGNLQLQL